MDILFSYIQSFELQGNFCRINAYSKRSDANHRTAHANCKSKERRVRYSIIIKNRVDFDDTSTAFVQVSVVKTSEHQQDVNTKMQVRAEQRVQIA